MCLACQFLSAVAAIAHPRRVGSGEVHNRTLALVFPEGAYYS